MNRIQYLSRLSMATAGHLTAAGCHILAAHAHGQRPVVIATLPPKASAEERRRILAEAWQSPIVVDWRG